MAEERQLQNNNISQFSKGLYQDNSFVDQPKGTYRFALNSVNETELGDFGFIGNEESNEICTSLPTGYIPIGKCYIGNNETVIFLVSFDNTISEIGILDNNCNYTTHVNDRDSIGKDKLNFKIEQQIQATYRLRRGCERTIYFTGKGYPPRYFNFDKPNQFKDGDTWDSAKFGLYKKLEKFPTINDIKVEDNSGNLTPGSYTIMVQHLDEDLNGTEFYELVKDINIYNDSLKNGYADIQGSSNIGDETSPYKYNKTNKSITISLGEVDKNFTYVRFAFVERTSGTGQISAVKYSDIISIHSPIFTYTGDNAKSQGTIEEVELFNLNAGIQTAEHIEQIDNMLMLANVQGEQAKVCNLQKYASKIKTDCYVKNTILTSVEDEHNSKNPLVVHNGLGYQPGEIYSLGIIYIFEDYSVSPAFHIPGKSSSVDKALIYSPGSNVYPMSNTKNKNGSEVYLDENSSCSNGNFWGVDSEGLNLKGTNVRHHRFPTRDEIGLGFVTKSNLIGENTKLKRLSLSINGDVKKSDGEYQAPAFTLIVRYKRNGEDEEFSQSVYPDSSVPFTIAQSPIFAIEDIITDIKLFYKEQEYEDETEIVLTNGESALQNNNLTYIVIEDTLNDNTMTAVYEAPILGLKLSNVELPPEEEIGKKVIGYQIVRQERRDIDKTILDSAVVFPMQKSEKNITTGLLAPEFYKNNTLTPATEEGSTDGTYPTKYNIDKKNVMLVSLGHRFMNKTFDGFTSMEQVGSFEKEYTAHTALSINDVYDGTSSSGEEDPKTKDSDGFSLRHAIRYTGVKYKDVTGTDKIIFENDNTRMYNLEGINYASAQGGEDTIYNLSSDNKALILSSSKSDVDLRTYRPGKNEFPYVYIKKDTNNFYQNFRSNPYYLASDKVFTTDTCTLFGGDTFISPLRYSNHVFGNAAVAMRRQKISAWKLIGSLVVVLAGAALAIFTGGTSLAASLTVAGGILAAVGGLLTGIATIVEAGKFAEIYGDKWQNGIDKTVFDYFYSTLFTREYPESFVSDKNWHIDKLYLSWQDDTFRWMGDIVGDLWFESSINASLRVAPTNVENNYLLPLKPYMSDNTLRWKNMWHAVDWIRTQILQGNGFHRYRDVSGSDFSPSTIEDNYFINKITKKDRERASGYSYQGISTPQIYLVNPDHYVTTGIKKFYTIPIEYDCCSDCVEKFPHRIHYSLQSFQEEKADNYRMFLPNNYRDIEGETGEITNMFRLYNNLYVHTKEGLWQMGRNYQERVTDNVVSFIGTGSYFEIPPQKMVDDETGNSAGCQHKWSGIKTPSGYFFVTENQRKIYQFDGKQLKPISNLGLSNWFENNTEITLDKDYLNIKGSKYPYADNPSNILGTGFISTYDTKKERIIFTKKDKKVSEDFADPKNLFCTANNVATIFYNYQDIIDSKIEQGLSYIGIENCRMKFSKEVIKYRKEKRYITQSIFKDVDYLVFRYNFSQADGRDLDTRTQLLEPFQSTTLGWCQNNPNTPYIAWASDNTGYGIEAVLIDIKKFKQDYPSTDKIVFNARAWWYGERFSGDMNMNAEGYKGGVMSLENFNFVNQGGELQGQYSFQTINIPLGGQSTCNPNPTNIGNFTYEISSGKLSWDGVSGGEIPPETVTVEIEVDVPYTDYEYGYIDGTEIPMQNIIEYDNSWTISFSLRNNTWVSWHSYIPNFYITVPEKFYSWVQGNNNLWIHNKLGHFQTYYGNHNPHIIEYISVSNPLNTKVWNYINLQTEAKTYDVDTKQYVDNRFITFNKAVIYNSRQCSGELDLVTKTEDSDFMMDQVINTNLNQSIIDRNERDWFINDFRDIRIDYSKPVWNSNISSLQSEYYIDKVLNTSTMDINKDWTQLESFRDKYLAVRLIFDNFADKKLITNFSIENEQQSF